MCSSQSFIAKGNGPDALQSLKSYDITIKATGRYFADFLESVDNIHSQFRFTYPKMQSPSMYLTDIDENGCVLVYRSRRSGFTQYIMGLLQQIAKDFFKLALKVRVLDKSSSATSTRNYVIVTFRLDFDNKPYTLNLQSVMFEMECNRGIVNFNEEEQIVNESRDDEEGTSSPLPGTKNILLKGQMKYIRDVNAVFYLCSPVINDLDDLTDQALYLNDLNPHGLSKELVLAGWQHNSK
ncbi:unnamed protein product [Acanthoscelides obtectus]|uniref:guanylate cyclase n=1 Tax=Acanthoscelides obtectus TaxID=200917 RepID=A0A9P0VN78_ACAOB|nr:unnamed protein product [Acanthoscelides obtectus]CAK1640578.1 Soluble guanylate cyclase 89Db [Acanthoscelides obtectus]